MNRHLAALPLLLPIVYAWAEGMEVRWLEEGVPLNEAQLADARAAGVKFPEKIRVVQVESLPHPDDQDVMFIARQVGLFGKDATALNLGYGICILPRKWNDRFTWVHECVHVGQHERMNGLRPFLAEYVRQCIDPGYPFGQLQQYATHIARDICKRAPGVSGGGEPTVA